MSKRVMTTLKKEEYEGKEFTVNCGWTCVVEEYIKYDNVIVRWKENGKTQKVNTGRLLTGLLRPVDFPSIVGLGINDMLGKVNTGRGSIYQKWVSMIKRCYCEKFAVGNPAYWYVEVDSEWFRLSNFYKWAKWFKSVEYMELDKDIYGTGYLYSPENCIFVPNYVNSFFLGMDSPRKFTWKDRLEKWEVVASDPTEGLERGQKAYIGVYSTKAEALEAYKEAKMKHLEIIIDRYRKEDFYSEEVEWKLRNNKIFDRLSYA